MILTTHRNILTSAFLALPSHSNELYRPGEPYRSMMSTTTLNLNPKKRIAIIMATMYKILSWHKANKLKDSSNAIFLLQLEYNLARVYLLSNWTFLVMPLNPFGNSLLAENQELVQKWIKERHFPSCDEPGKLNLDRGERIEDLMARKEEFIKALCAYILRDRTQSTDRLSAYEINDLYILLHHKRQYDRFKLHFTFLVGDHIISRQEDADWRWGLMRTRQYLNPLNSLVLVPNENPNNYYDLEELIEKKDFSGAQCYMKTLVKEGRSHVNDLVEIAKVIKPVRVAR